MPEVRCDKKKHAVVSDNSIGFLEIACDSDFCKGFQKGTIVVHRWNLGKISEDGIIRPESTTRTKRFTPQLRGT